MNNFISIEYKCLKVYGNFLTRKPPYTFSQLLSFYRCVVFVAVMAVRIITIVAV